ncbi:hypothetical protein OKW43_001903 [Paraburkholderia sp. WC7.3g]
MNIVDMVRASEQVVIEAAIARHVAHVTSGTFA